MNNIISDIGLPTLFIRYNPDLKHVTKSKKHKKLLETLNTCLNLESLENLDPIYLFYV